MQEGLSEHQETIPCCGGDQALEQVAWRAGRLSILGDTGKLSGRDPEHPGVGVLA